MDTRTYIAFLRGINVGGHHKLPMADLKKEMQMLGFKNIVTILNSGNVLFDTTERGETAIEDIIAFHLEKRFGFKVPTLVRNSEDILQLMKSDPFGKIEVTKDIRLYVTFLKMQPEVQPWTSEDGSFRVIAIQDRWVSSVLDLSKAKTPKGMEALEAVFGKNITTRNWNTIEKIAGKLKSGNNL